MVLIWIERGIDQELNVRRDGQVPGELEAIKQFRRVLIVERIVGGIALDSLAY